MQRAGYEPQYALLDFPCMASTSLNMHLLALHNNMIPYEHEYYSPIKKRLLSSKHLQIHKGTRLSHLKSIFQTIKQKYLSALLLVNEKRTNDKI